MGVALGLLNKCLKMAGDFDMGSGPPFSVLQGINVPKFVLQEELDKLKDFQLYPDDVWVVTYPKCGTTWTQQIVRLIKNKGVQDDIIVDHAVPWLEAKATAYPDVQIEKLTRPRAFKSHFPYDLLPCGPPHTTPCKYIFIARNPKDVAVSLYFHTKLRYYPDIDWDSFWKLYINGELEFGNYFDHLVSWWPHRNDKNVLFLKYEDMKKNLPQAVCQIASFMGVDLPPNALDQIVHLTTFENMKRDPTANNEWTRAQQKENAAPFMRKGIVGDWKNFLSPGQSAEVDRICAGRLKDIGLEFEYE